MGDVTVQEENSTSQKTDSNNNEKENESTLKPDEIKKSHEKESVIEACKRTDINKTDKKQTNSKDDIFHIEVEGEKSNEPEESTGNTPVSIPTPRRMNKLRDHSSTIFPVGCMGCREDPPSDHIASPRRFLDPIEARDHIGHIDNTPRKRPSSAKPHAVPRNPLTGVGVEEEIKKPFGKRKDGNPLLGEGYETKQVTPSCTRIPPGGYSQGLW